MNPWAELDRWRLEMERHHEREKPPPNRRGKGWLTFAKIIRGNGEALRFRTAAGGSWIRIEDRGPPPHHKWYSGRRIRADAFAQEDTSKWGSPLALEERDRVLVLLDRFIEGGMPVSSHPPILYDRVSFAKLGRTS